MKSKLRPLGLCAGFALLVLLVPALNRIAAGAEAPVNQDAALKSAFGDRYYIEAPQGGTMKIDSQGDDTAVVIEHPSKNVNVVTDDFNILCRKFVFTKKDSMVLAEAVKSGVVEIKSASHGFDAKCDNMEYNTATGSITLIGNAEFVQKSQGNPVRMVGDRIDLIQEGEENFRVVIFKLAQSSTRRPRVLTGAKAAGGVAVAASAARTPATSAQAPIPAIPEPTATSADSPNEGGATVTAGPVQGPPERGLIKE